MIEWGDIEKKEIRLGGIVCLMNAWNMLEAPREGNSDEIKMACLKVRKSERERGRRNSNCHVSNAADLQMGSEACAGGCRLTWMYMLAQLTIACEMAATERHTSTELDIYIWRWRNFIRQCRSGIEKKHLKTWTLNFLVVAARVSARETLRTTSSIISTTSSIFVECQKQERRKRMLKSFN